jgi:selenocysteine lyase/cysteine desulfurase
MNWEHVYRDFPVNNELVWLNNCGVAPPGNHILRAMSNFFKGYARRCILSDGDSYPGVKAHIKAILADLLGCAPEELALIHNTAEGMNFISHGLDLQAGDEVILLENEYPSNVYPWRHLEGRGVVLRTAPMADTPEGFLAGLEPTITPRTRVMALSAVHWCTGMPLPLEAIGRRCRAAGIELVVDGAQGVGLQPIDVHRGGIGYMAFSAWKWLMGPLGLGVLFVARENLGKVPPVFFGTESVVRDGEYLPYRRELKPTADRFTFSTANFNDWVYFKAALEYLQEIGFDTVRRRIFDLCAHLSAGLRRNGYTLCADRFPAWPTGVAVCERPGSDTAELMRRLKSGGVVAAERLGRIRFGPHIFNSEDQLDRVAAILAAR